MLALLLSSGIVAANTYYVVEAVQTPPLPSYPAWVAACVVLGACYLALVSYLVLHMTMCIGLFPKLADTEVSDRASPSAHLSPAPCPCLDCQAARSTVAWCPEAP